MSLISKEHLLQQLDGRPEDGWISIKAMRTMIEAEEEREEQKTGEWINLGHIPGPFKHPYSEDYQCSVCGFTVYGWGWTPKKFCEKCGARMGNGV